MRFVKALAPEMGCSESHLRRQARAVGISLASLVDWTTLLQGVSLHQERLMPWTRIALRMGFSDHSAMSDQFKRTSGNCPRELGREPWRILMVQALQGVTECAGLAGEVSALDS